MLVKLRPDRKSSQDRFVSSPGAYYLDEVFLGTCTECLGFKFDEFNSAIIFVLFFSDIGRLLMFSKPLYYQDFMKVLSNTEPNVIPINWLKPSSSTIPLEWFLHLTFNNNFYKNKQTFRNLKKKFISN